jgi:hypothetical protein
MSQPFKSIAEAPRSGEECFLIDVYADAPQWGIGFWVDDYQAYFSGSHDDYRLLCEEIEAGEAEPEELECSFWPQPTHFAPMLPIPPLCN